MKRLYYHYSPFLPFHSDGVLADFVVGLSGGYLKKYNRRSLEINQYPPTTKN